MKRYTELLERLLNPHTDGESGGNGDNGYLGNIVPKLSNSKLHQYVIARGNATKSRSTCKTIDTGISETDSISRIARDII